MAEPAASVSTSREDWIREALRILVEHGAAEVKVLTLARRLGCSRSNFYWFFKDRDALLDALLDHWQAQNTQVIVERAGRPAQSIAQGILNIFDSWADPALFDARLDFAVREWARRFPRARAAVREADQQRVEAIAALFARFGAVPDEAVVRARTLYFMQIGYYALDVRESDEERFALVPHYVEAFSGERATEAELRDFFRRHGRLGLDRQPG